jgi:hypothetical protein
MTMSFRAASIAVIVAASAMSADAANRDFRFVNNSGQTLWELYVSPASDDTWNRDVLGQSVLESNRAMMIRFPGKGEECVYDLKMVMENGDSYTTQLNLCQISEYELK